MVERVRAATEVRFPWIPVLAPLLVAVTLWITTGTSITLLFGVLSPALAVAHFLENRRVANRRLAAEASREVAERRSSEEQAEAARASEAAACRAELPAACDLVDLMAVARWERTEKRQDPLVRIGLDEYGFPVSIRASDGVLFAQRNELSRQSLRAMTAQLWWVTGDLSRHVTPAGTTTARWLVTAGTTTARILDRDHPGIPERKVQMDVLDASTLHRFKEALIAKRNENLTRYGSQALSPVRVSVASELRELRESRWNVIVGDTNEGIPLAIDIVRHGPHVMVSGMTGSGKTSFIRSWLLELADRFDPTEFNIVVIDFKGGIDFGPLAGLVHSAGFATDADEGSIERAFRGLEAEMMRRELVIREHGSLASLPRLVVVLDEFRATATAHPRAVPAVIDLVSRGRALGIHVIASTQRSSTSVSEDIMANVPLRIAFRALSDAESRFMVGHDAAHRELAAPGEAVIAGLGSQVIKVSMSAGGLTVPSASTPENTCHIDSRSTGNTGDCRDVHARQLWMPALPRQIALDVAREATPYSEPPRTRARANEDAPFSASRTCLGLVDVPDRQRWESVWFDPLLDGHLIVSGPAGSGRSSALQLIAGQLTAAESHSGATLVVTPIHDAVQLWDCVDERFANHVPDKAHEVVFVDGWEVLCAQLRPDTRDALTERLVLQARTSPRRTFVISCDDRGSAEQRLAMLSSHRLSIGSSGAPPGRTRWHQFEMQMAWAGELNVGSATINAVAGLPDRIADDSKNIAAVPLTRPCLEVGSFGHVTDSNESNVRREQLSAVGLNLIESTTADGWIRRLTEFATLAQTHAVVVGNLHPGDARLLLRDWTPLPPVREGERLVLYPEGTYTRLRGGR